MAEQPKVQADRIGVVAAIMAPDHPHADFGPCFTFSIERSSPSPPMREVLYADLAMPGAAALTAVVTGAFVSGHEVQIGLSGAEGDPWRWVRWVQAVRRI